MRGLTVVGLDTIAISPYAPAFFTVDTLDTQLQQREAELAAGDTSKVTDMRYLKSTGQFFLHEMMHTQLVGQPHSKSFQ